MADRPYSKRLTLTVDWPEITLENLSRIAGLWSNLVRSVSAEAAGKETAIKWVVRNISLNTPLNITADPEPVSKKLPPDVVSNVSHVVVVGMDHLARFPDPPDNFSDKSLSIARKLSLFANSELQRRLVVSNGHDGPVELTPRIAATVDGIFGPTTESYGTVEGTLEGVLTHNRRRFYVYDSLTGREVRCYFDESLPLQHLWDAFEKRVSVSGVIRAKAKTGERLSITPTEPLKVFEPDNSLKTIPEILQSWRTH